MARILIVEDDPSLQKCLRFSLKQHGHETAVTGYVEEAKRMILAGVCDLLLTDYQLSQGSTGLDLIAFLRARNFRTPVILMSGCHESNFLDKVSEQGVFAFLGKPFELTRLARLCDEALLPKT